MKPLSHGILRSLLAFVLALAPTLTAARAVAAQGGDPAERAARAHFARAEKAFNLGKFADALAGYEAAFEAKAMPALLFNIAQCHRNLGDPERALFFYRRYLTLEPRGPHRELVLELVEEQELALQTRSAASPRPSEPVPTAAVGTHAPVTPELLAPQPAPPPEPEPPLYRRWWVWGLAGAAVAGAAAALLITRDGALPRGQLDSVDRR